MMTRHSKTVASRRIVGNSAILSPISPTQSLTQELVERLRSQIASGRLLPGERLPTELSMVAATGVSRTVVREAVAALKAEGLVVTRQGSGAFVAQDPTRRAFRIDAAGLGDFEQVLQILDLRLAVEIEAAATASSRGSSKDIRAIEATLKSFDRARRRGESAAREDFSFHRAIAAATGNAHFVRFLEFLGVLLIPRRTIQQQNATAESEATYLEQIASEHRAIFEAIAGHDAEAARVRMRSHLERSSARYRKLAAAAR